MALSAERKASLADRYELWGIDEVRKELAMPDRDQFVDPEVTAFAQTWIETKEVDARRKANRLILLVTVGLVLLGLAIAVFLEL